MVFAQMTSRENLRDITTCLNARSEVLYHLGFTEPVAKSTLADANNLKIPALTVAMLYKMRWRIELFFRWIKGHLRIKHYYGTSPNAVKTQIWIAITTYLIIAILHKQLKLPGTLHRTLQLLSVHPFEKVTLNELLMETDHRTFINSDPNQLNLFEL